MEFLAIILIVVLVYALFFRKKEKESVADHHNNANTPNEEVIDGVEVLTGDDVKNYRADFYKGDQYAGTIHRTEKFFSEENDPFSVRVSSTSYSNKNRDKAEKIREKIWKEAECIQEITGLPIGFKKKRFADFSAKVSERLSLVKKMISDIEELDFEYNKYAIEKAHRIVSSLYIEILDIENALEHARNGYGKYGVFDETKFWRSALQQAVNLDSEKTPEIAKHLIDIFDEKAHKMLADFYFSRSEYQKSCELYRTALDINPKTQGVKMRIKECEKHISSVKA